MLEIIERIGSFNQFFNRAIQWVASFLFENHDLTFYLDICILFVYDYSLDYRHEWENVNFICLRIVQRLVGAEELDTQRFRTTTIANKTSYRSSSQPG